MLGSVGVDSGEGVIEKNVLGERVHGTGEGNPSLLTTTERHALVTNLGLVAVLEDVKVGI